MARPPLSSFGHDWRGDLFSLRYCVHCGTVVATPFAGEDDLQEYVITRGTLRTVKGQPECPPRLTKGEPHASP